MSVLLIDDDSFSSRFQFVGNAAPVDSARGRGRQGIEQIKRRRNRPEQQVRRQTLIQPFSVARKRQRHCSKTNVSLGGAEPIDDKQNQQRRAIRKLQRDASGSEQQASEKYGAKQKATDKQWAPEMRGIHSRDLQLPVGEFKQFFPIAIAD